MKISDIINAHIFTLDEDINGITNYLNVVYLAEAAISGKTIEKHDKVYLQGLQSDNSIIEKQYSVAMVFCMPNSQIILYGSNKPMTLTNIFTENGLTIYQFNNRKTYPESRDTKLSFTKTFLFNNGTGLDNFLSAIALKFNTTTDLKEVTGKHENI